MSAIGGWDRSWRAGVVEAWLRTAIVPLGRCFIRPFLGAVSGSTGFSSTTRSRPIYGCFLLRPPPTPTRSADLTPWSISFFPSTSLSKHSLTFPFNSKLFTSFFMPRPCTDVRTTTRFGWSIWACYFEDEKGKNMEDLELSSNIWAKRNAQEREEMGRICFCFLDDRKHARTRIEVSKLALVKTTGKRVWGKRAWA